ncbi:hypothetical protein D3C80_2099610 [compost metagenome]
MAPVVQQLCDDFLATASFTSHEHINIRIGYIAQGTAQIFHRRCLADQRQIALHILGGFA